MLAQMCEQPLQQQRDTLPALMAGEPQHQRLRKALGRKPEVDEVHACQQLPDDRRSLRSLAYSSACPGQEMGSLPGAPGNRNASEGYAHRAIRAALIWLNSRCAAHRQAD